MNTPKKLIVSALLAVMVLPISSVTAAFTLQQAVNSIQATDPALPTGVSNPKGSIGSLLAELFWGTGDGVKNGKIKPQYLDYSGISAWTQSGSEAYYSGTGNVGIGTTNPTEKLHIFSDMTGGWTESFMSIEKTHPSIFSTRYLTKYGALWFDSILPWGTSGNIQIQVTWGDQTVGGGGISLKTNGNNTRMFIRQDGNVGIGTTSPNKLLHLKTTTGTNAEFDIQSGTKPLWGIYHDEGTEELRFWNGSNRVVFGSGGNVGIGTTIPTTALHVLQNGVGIAPSLTADNGLATFSTFTTPQLQIGGYPTSPYAMWMQVKRVFNDGNSYPLSIQPLGGNVGIGTASPGYKLEISENRADWATRIVNSNANAYGLVVNNTSTSGTGFILGAVSSGVYRFAVLNNGNVGIGTTNPVYKLTLQDGTFGIGDTAQGSAAAFSYSAGKLQIWLDSAGTDGIYFRTYSGGYGDRMVIKNTGNIGIGTSSPTSKLHVINAGTSNPSLTHGAAAMFALAPGSGTELVMGGMAGSPYTAWIQHRHQTNDGSSFNLALQPSGGNVGIGTTSPSALLTVSWQNTPWRGQLMIKDDNLGNNADAYMSFWSGDENGVGNTGLLGYVGFVSNSDNSLSIGTYPNAGHLLLNQWGGNVGIGTTSPWYKLTVVGPAADWTIVANPANTQQYGLLSYGTTWAGYFVGPGYINQSAWTYGSDRRLKENIVYFNSGLEKVLQLKPAAYDYISGTKNNLGFIAQDVQQVIPEAVSITDSKTGMLGLKTEFIIPYLVNAMKELKSQKDSEIQELKKDNNKLKQENQEIKALVCLDHPNAAMCK
ncbi:MAG: hypothetical protein ACD_78C00065G0004 [uncultured bacterium (gcode 4)]|uniref:Peptidase S74 domain-containing protein n=1 Tax=uncultured bacterium (gcode 4) TaxID=1234023 RepID=K1YYB0_9BACT|nr:MAG: hypothetical protein ACD_78C00065G0004 [uncultured bacterium (gcode 4)]